MTEREVSGVLGIVIGLASSMIVIVLQHILSLRADKIKRERDRDDEEEREMREIARKAEPSFFKRARYIKWLSKSKGKK